MEESNQAESSKISTSLEVEQIDVNLFRSVNLFKPARGRGVFGGQVISQAIVSATKCVDPAFGLHVSLSLFPFPSLELNIAGSPFMYALEPPSVESDCAYEAQVLLPTQRVPRCSHCIFRGTLARGSLVQYTQREGSPERQNHLSVVVFIPYSRAMAALAPVVNTGWSPKSRRVRAGGRLVPASSGSRRP